MEHTKVSINKLRGSEDFHKWKFAISSLFEMLSLSEAVKPGGGTLDATKAGDQQKLQQAKNLLILNIEPDLYSNIEDYTTAAEIWAKLCGMYEDSGMQRRISLLRQLMSVRLESKTMQEYVSSITTLANKLKAIKFNLDDDWLVSILLAGLTEEYNPFIMGLEASMNTGTTLKPDAIINKLLDGDNKQGGSGGTAFAANKVNRGASTPTSSAKKSGKIKCFNCGKKGHFANKCRSKKSGDKEAFIAVEVAAMVEASAPDGVVWLIDSGASSHMTGRKDILTDVISRSGQVTIANNQMLSVEAAGKTLILTDDGEVELQNVLYVPGLGVNLISVNEVVAHGYNIEFGAKECRISKGGRRVLTCKQTRGTYKIKQSNHEVANAATNHEVAMWHRKLGHVSGNALKKTAQAVDGIKLNSKEIDDSKVRSMCIW